MVNENEKKLLEAGRQALVIAPAESSQELNDRLAVARRQALALIPEKSSSRHLGYYFGGAIAASVLAFIVYFTIPNQYSENEASVVSDFEALLESEEFDMLENDIDFYVWLEDQTDDET